nr:hypothetical protein [Comamonas koreensis]
MNLAIRQAPASDAASASRLVIVLAHYFLSDAASAESRPFMARLTSSAGADSIRSSQFKHLVAENTAEYVALRHYATGYMSTIFG